MSQYNTQHALRFIYFMETLDLVNEHYQAIDVVSIFENIINNSKYLVKNHGSKKCHICTLKDRDVHGNTRSAVPNSILESIHELKSKGYIKWNPVDRAKVPTTWMTCYVYNIQPDRTKPNWEYFQCSHRCINGSCIRDEHLCWESPKDNQGRGKRICSMKCKHEGCGKCLCDCQRIHNPPCVIEE